MPVWLSASACLMVCSADAWNGVKFMLHYLSASEGPRWHHPSGLFGTFDWQPLEFMAPIAMDASGGEIDLGLQDCIELFEEYGWDWTCHAYREWDGWSVEHGSDPGDHTPSAAPTDRQKLLLKWFARNEKPRS